jgi:D-3-phosphoglycerate dehydrogenase
MHIVIADPLPHAAVTLLRSVPYWTIDDRAGRPAADLARDLAQADALIVRSATRVDAALLEAAPRLRAVARAGTGVDNVDVEAASARGIVVMNAPGANAVSVAEHACALMLALARAIPAADAAMKQGRWEKRALTGEELRGKTLGIVGLGRIGQELAQRARGFGMLLVAHDPFISEQVAADLGVSLVALDDLCAQADYISLHVPSTPATRGLFGAARLAACKRGVRIINTARGDLIDEDALVTAIEAGQVGGAGLDVFQVEPPPHGRLTSLPRVIATPHIAASTAEAQELVGLETAASVIDFLRDGTVRNAVNFPSIGAEEFARLRPYLRLGEGLGALLGQLARGRTHAVGIRYYGTLNGAQTDPVAAAVLTGLFAPMLSTPVTLVNARAIAAARSVEVVESRSSRQRTFTSLVSVKLHTSEGERWAEGAVFEPESPRLVLLDGVDVEAPLGGTLIVIRNVDRPGVIGEVGTLLGRHGINIASFALGRAEDAAVGIVNIDEGAQPIPEAVLDEIRRVPAVREAVLIRFR